MAESLETRENRTVSTKAFCDLARIVFKKIILRLVRKFTTRNQRLQ